MIKYLPDTNIISRICYPNNPKNLELVKWFRRLLLLENISIYLPAIVLYEAKRGLMLQKLKDSSSKGLERLEALSTQIELLPVTQVTWDKAAELWAKNRFAGTPTSSPESIDGDLLLASQALEIGGIVITENLKHLKPLVAAINWHEYPFPEKLSLALAD